MIKKVKPLPIEKVVSRYFDKSKKCKHDADLAFKKCFKYFRDERLLLQQRLKNANKVPDEAMLRLHAYLANWGMFRGSGKLRKKNYTVHKGAIKIMLGKEFDVLYKPLPYFIVNKKVDKFINLIIRLRDKLKKHYEKNCISSTDTLISKIIKAVFGCVVGYDSEVVKNFGKKVCIPKEFNKESLKGIICFYKTNQGIVDKLASKYKETAMRIMDVYFWAKK